MSNKKIKRPLRAFANSENKTAEGVAVPAEVKAEAVETTATQAEAAETESVEVVPTPVGEAEMAESAAVASETATTQAEANETTEASAEAETEAETPETETAESAQALAAAEAAALAQASEKAAKKAAKKLSKAAKKAAKKAKRAEAKQHEKEEKFQEKQAKKETRKRRRPNLFIPFVFGITIAFTFGCGTLCKLILENSANFLFTTTEDIVLADFVGMTADDVELSSQYSHLDIVYEEAYNSDIAEGFIYKQSPVDGRTVKEGQTVTLTVSLGTKYVTIPDYTGLTQSEAQEALLAEGVYVQVLKNVDSSVAVGSVIRTEPAAGQSVEAGSTVYLYVSMAQVQTTTTMPNLVGLTLEDSKSVFTRKKISMGNISYDFSLEYPADVIMAQAVEPGGSVAINGRVAITVSLGPGPVEGYVYIDPDTIS